MSPHIWVWKWHVTMLTSILHRASGMALFAGSFVVVGWLFAITLGEEAYDAYAGLVGSPLGILVMIAFTAAALYHLLNGIRHLVWDVGHGYKPATANMTAWATIILAALGTVGIWAYILLNVVEF